LSLRLLLVRSIAFIFLATLALGALLIYWHAVQRVNADMHASMDVGRRIVDNAVDDAEEVALPRRRLELLVADFNGDRNLRAVLFNPDNSLAFNSYLQPPEHPVSEFLFNLLAAPPVVESVQLPPAFKNLGTLMLESDAHNEVGDVWNEAALPLTILAVFCGLILLVLYFTLGRALKPLEDLTFAFARIGNGDYRARVAAFSPRELTRLSTGFNEMAMRLAEMEHRNHRLHEQLETVQEEERIELARNLHDEVSPLLFSVDVDAMTIKELAQVKDLKRIIERAHAIRSAVADMKRNVKALLGQLRPSGLHALSLASAIENLISYWKGRRPEITFTAECPDKSWGSRIDSALYSIIRESLNNAVKHTKPSRIEVLIEETYHDVLVVRVLDDGCGLDASAVTGGFGLIGMKERAALLGGTLVVENRRDSPGVAVTARLPLPSESEDGPYRGVEEIAAQ
jgi:two-component system, NarL family, sensor histidine kinase UhpB